MSFKSCIGCVSFVLIPLVSVFFYFNPDWFIMILPIPLDDTAMRFLYDSSRTNDPSYWAPEPLFTYMHDHPVDKISDVVDPVGHPRFVKNYVDPPTVDHIISTLARENRGKTIRVLNWENHLNHIGNCGGVPRNKTVMNFEDYAEKLESVKNLYAGFEMITEASVVNGLLGFDMQDIKPGHYKQNNLFFSNFDKTVMSAGLHCAPIDSVAIQLAGHKTWLLAGPTQLATQPAIPLPTFFMFGKTDDDMLDNIREYRVVQQGPGDALYFGPNWCHAVITHEGPNVMFNARFNAKKKIREGPKSLLFKILFRMYTRTFGGNPQDNEIQQGPIYATINNQFDNCGTSNRLEQIVKRFDSEFPN